jgi:uncharacterized protein (DUF983 family)
VKHTEPSSGPQAGHAGAEAHWARVFGRSWRGLCPRCGVGKVFESTFRLCPRCPECELVLRAEAGSMTGQMYLAAAVGEVTATAVAVIIWLATDWSIWVSLAVLVPLMAIFSFWFLPRSMSLWVAVDYLTDRYQSAYTPDGPKGPSSQRRD